MSYAAEHLAWQQRLLKEQVTNCQKAFSPAKIANRNQMSTRGVAEDYAKDMRKSDPNSIGDYAFKKALKSIIKNKTKKINHDNQVIFILELRFINHIFLLFC